ncbi:MAG: hypothetical protein PHG35_03510 [Dehalococcoidales bacterium]|nr:hypothetical protein [Dehalococcoidales bacterium]
MVETAIKLCWEVDGRGRNRRCRDWDGCPGHDYYSLHDNQYCRMQCIWIIDNCIDYVGDKYISVGWPSEEKGESGYNDTPVQHSQPSSAGFTRPIQEIAEVIKRLERTGKDGRLLLIEVKNAELKLKHGSYVQEYSHEARNALNYCCAWKRKHRSYRQWLADRQYKK